MMRQNQVGGVTEKKKKSAGKKYKKAQGGKKGTEKEIHNEPRGKRAFAERGGDSIGLGNI